MEEKEKSNYGISGMVFAGCMFIGMAIGTIYDQTGVGTLIGMGVGFIVSAIVESNKKK